MTFFGPPIPEKFPPRRNGHQSENRRARRLRLYRRGSWCGCCCAIRAPRSCCSPPSAAPGRRCARCFPQFAVRAAEACFDRQHRLADGAPRSRLLRAAARDHAEGDQGPARPRRRRPRSSISPPISGSPTRRLCALVRPRAPGARAAAGGGLRADRGLSRARSSPRGSSPIRAATRPARSSPLVPLLEAKAIDPDEIVIDAKSGMTGAGRAAKEEMLFSEVSGGLPRLRRRPPPPHGRARPGILQGRRPRGDRDLHAASRADEPRHPLDHLCARRGNRRKTCTRYF